MGVGKLVLEVKDGCDIDREWTDEMPNEWIGLRVSNLRVDGWRLNEEMIDENLDLNALVEVLGLTVDERKFGKDVVWK